MTQESVSADDTPRVPQAEDFEPLVGRDVRFGDTGFALVLASVEYARRAPPTGAPRAPFTLIFSGPKGATYLMDGLYHCDFGDGAAYEIHVAPIHTADPVRQDYQAVFN